MYVSTDKFPKKPLVKDLNDVLTCHLCRGYLIDATITDKCMHLFCRSCIVAHLRNKTSCPLCGVNINRLKRDKTYQTLVYKLIPGLYDAEVMRRIEFAKGNHCSKDKKGIVSVVDPIDEAVLSSQDPIMISLSYCDDDSNNAKKNTCRYLECPASFTVHHLKTFIRKKYGLCNFHPVFIYGNNMTFADNTTMLDIAYSCSWNRLPPLKLQYKLLKCLPVYGSDRNLGAAAWDKLESSGSHHTVAAMQETSVCSSSVPVDFELGNNTCHHDNQECGSSVQTDRETELEDSIVEHESNCLEYGDCDTHNLEEISYFSSMGPSEVKNICKMMSDVELKEKRNEVIPSGSGVRMEKENECAVVSRTIKLKKYRVDKYTKEFKGIGENSHESPVKSVLNLAHSEQCNRPRQFNYVETSDSPSSEASWNACEEPTQIQVPHERIGELSCNDDNINATAVRPDKNVEQVNYIYACDISLACSAPEQSVLVDQQNMFHSADSPQCIEEMCSDSSENTVVYIKEEEEDGDIQSLYNSGLNIVSASCSNSDVALDAYTDNIKKQCSNSEAMGNVAVESELKQFDGIMNSNERKIDLSPCITNHKAREECNNNTLKNVMVNDGEEPVTKCKQTVLHVAMPEFSDGSCVNSTVSAEVTKQCNTDELLPDSLVATDELIVKEVVEELVSRHSLDGLVVEHGVEEIVAECETTQANICHSTISGYNEDLNDNSSTSVIPEADPTNEKVVLENECEALPLNFENNSSANTVEQTNVCIGFSDCSVVSDINGCKDILCGSPFLKHEELGSVLSRGTENIFDKSGDHDEKPDEALVHAILATDDVKNDLPSSECKVPDLCMPELEIVRKVDEKALPLCDKTESTLIVCSKCKELTGESKENITLYKMNSTFSCFAMKQDDTVKDIVLQDKSKHEPDSEGFSLGERKLSSEGLIVDLLATKDELTWLKNFKGFTKDLVKPLPKPKIAVSSDLEKASISSCLECDDPKKNFDSSGAENKSKCVNKGVHHESASGNGPVAENIAEGMPELLCWDGGDDWDGLEQYGSSSLENFTIRPGETVCTEMSSQKFLRLKYTQKNCCPSKCKVRISQKCCSESCKHSLCHENNGSNYSEITGRKLILQPRIVLHRIKRDSSSISPPRKIKVRPKLSRGEHQVDDIAMNNISDATKIDSLCAAIEAEETSSKMEDKPNYKITHQEQHTMPQVLVDQKIPECLFSTQRVHCSHGHCLMEQGKRNGVKRADIAEEQYTLEEQNNSSMVVHQEYENCFVRKRKVSSMEGNTASDSKMVPKRRVHKCPRSVLGNDNVDKTLEGKNLKTFCSLEGKADDKTHLLCKNQDIFSVTTGQDSQPGDECNSSREGPDNGATQCMVEAKDVRVIVERCDGKMKLPGVSASPALENKEATVKIEDLNTKCSQDDESKLQSFSVMLTRLAPPAPRGTMKTDCSDNKSLRKLEDVSLCKSISAPECETKQLPVPEPVSIVTSPSAGCTQRVGSKNRSGSKTVCSEITRPKAKYVEEELTQDFEMNINIMCGQ